MAAKVGMMQGRLNLLTRVEFAIILVLATLLTGSEIPEASPGAALVLRLSAYGAVLGVTIHQVLISWRTVSRPLQSFFESYRQTILWPILLYFAGLAVGSLNGPTPLYSLWQTASDLIVFMFAFAAFGWLHSNLNEPAMDWLRITAAWSFMLMLAAVPIYVGNLSGWWLINPFYWDNGVLLLNGPFNHANHMGYVLMSGSLAAGSLAVSRGSGLDRKWASLALILALAELPTFARGAILGTTAGLISLLAIRHRRLALSLGSAAATAALALTAATALGISLPEFIPKQTFSARGELWGLAVQNLQDYGPLGVGPGNAESIPGFTMHNFWLEQYGEGGILTLVGALGLIALPIIRLRLSAMERRLALAIIAMMVGLMVHGIFWGQFLIGLRHLTVVYVPLWIALATPRNLQERRSPASTVS